MANYLLTTVDNPHDPRTKFDEWNAWDVHAGYHTLALLGRIINTSDDLSGPDQELAINQAIDDIVRENVSGMHKKVQIGEVAS